MLRKANGRSNSQGSGYSAPPERAPRGNSGKAGDREMQLVSDEIRRLVEASRQGNLEERGQIDQFQGVHREIVQGINEMLDAILIPIGEGNRVLIQVSNGRIDEF